jgi:NAD(P)-dependent dehydrogenase (short-subunit alcohol dehydrogenase family)
MEPDPKYQGSLQQTLDEITAAGGSAVAIQADLSQSDDRERIFDELIEKVGAPDILVNNAAVTFLRPLDNFPERRARLMIEMHVLAPMHLIQLAIPAMRERGRGWVLNVTSVGGDLPEGPPFSEFDRTAGFGVYGTVKAALNRLTKSFAAELYDDGIAVNAAAPSNPVATEGAGALDLAKTDTEDIGLITQTALTLVTGDPASMTGRIAHTQPFLREIGWLH